MIPSVVHRIWLGPFRMPDDYVAYGEAWERLGYEVRLWTDDDLPDIINRDVWDRVEREGVNTGGGIPATGVYVQRADILQYEVVWRFGGIYANCDIEPLRRLDLEGVSAFAGWEEDGQFVGTALIGGTAGHPFWRAVIDRLPQRYDDKGGCAMNEQTGPHLVTEVHKSTPGLHVFPQRYFYPFGFGDMANEGNRERWLTPNPWVVHHWGHRKPHLLGL